MTVMVVLVSGVLIVGVELIAAQAALASSCSFSAA